LIAGLGGALYAMFLGIVTPESFALMFSAQFLMMIVLGGMRVLGGAVVGAALVWWLQLNLSGFAVNVGDFELAILPGAVFGLAVVAVILFLPEGLLGGTQRLARWALARIRSVRTPTTGEGRKP